MLPIILLGLDCFCFFSKTYYTNKDAFMITLTAVFQGGCLIVAFLSTAESEK